MFPDKFRGVSPLSVPEKWNINGADVRKRGMLVEFTASRGSLVELLYMIF
jgi:hypothetical protein